MSINPIQVPDSSGKKLNIHEGPRVIHLGQIEVRFLLENKDTDGRLAAFEFTVPAGVKVPAPHSHAHYDETIYGLAGVMTFTVNGRPTDLSPGEACFIPRGAVHGFNNLKPVPAKALAVATPALIGRNISATSPPLSIPAARRTWRKSKR